MSHRRIGTLTAALLLVLAACGDDTPTPQTPTGAPNPAVTTGAAATTPGTADCAGAAAKVQAKLARPGVQGVTIEGQCTTVVIATTLSDGDAAVAKQLCLLAAEVAYVGDVNAIRVLGQSKKELSQGIKGASCL